MKKILAAVLALGMAASMAACSSSPAADTPGEYTYRMYTNALGNNWNPHTWENSADKAILTYLETPLAKLSVLDSQAGEFQWVFQAATGITDVTALHPEDLVRYNVTLPQGQKAEDITAGYVFEIALNPEMKWEDGTPINADSYIYSMKALLDPAMRNYRANLYYAGESAVAGGEAYYFAGSSAWKKLADAAISVEDLIPQGDGYVTPAGDTVYVENGKEPAALTGTLPEDVTGLVYEKVYPVCEYEETVGLYKVDDMTIRYVTQTQIDYNNFLTSCTSNFLVHEGLYEAGKDTSGSLVTTNYGTSLATTMSYGPYKLSSLQSDKQAVLVQNENWYNYRADESGSLVAYTDYLVDGESVRQYQTTRIVMDVMTDEAAKQAFMKGELSLWTPPADEIGAYASSTQMYRVDEPYTMSFFFNTDLEALKAMDRSKGNTNSVVLSNSNFRKAFSLAIDRADWVTATAGFKPAYALMNGLYHYDIYNDPQSSYRSSEAAMEAVCQLYGISYGEGTPYADLKAAYSSINGYNLTQARALMKTACEELAAAGLYTPGERIHIRIGYKAGALDSADQNQMAKLNQYLNAAAQGSGFGAITLEAVDNIANRYGDVASGEYAMGYGAWGGAIFYPFRNMQVYCDTEQYSIHEAACWDPATETLTLMVADEPVTMTWQDWSRALIGTGPYANADVQVKLAITAALEKNFLEKYYRIPMASSCTASLLSYQANYYTDDYNIMYEFGGLELMTYNYTDAQWADYVAAQGGTLRYE